MGGTEGNFRQSGQPAERHIPVKQLTVIHPGALGDSLLSLPAIVHLKSVFPGASINLIGYPPYWEWLRGGLVAGVYSPDTLPLYRLFDPSFSTPPPELEFLSRQDLIISWFGDETFRRNLRTLCSGPVSLQPYQPETLREHASRFFLHSLQIPGIPPPQGDVSQFILPEIPLPAGDFPFDSDGPRVVIHPGSGSPRKCWPAANFAQIVQRLQRAFGIRPLLLFGEADREIREALRHMVSSSAAQFAEGLSLAEVATILRNSDCYLGNDSGLSHLAGLLGTPSLVLFGPTDPSIWRPLGPRVRVLYHPELRQSVASVWEHLLELLEPVAR